MNTPPDQFLIDIGAVIPVFAYGTLQKGHGNAVRCIENGVHDYVGAGITTDKYLMSNVGIAFVHRPEKATWLKPAQIEAFAGHIAGDLWFVDADGLARCDSLEGHPHSYCREAVGVKVGEKTYTAWLYFYHHGTRVDGGSLEAPDANGVVRWGRVPSRWLDDEEDDA